MASSTLVRSASYVSGCTNYSACPIADKPEYAFTGRSNVGKSSLINALSGIQGLAKTSSTPGKTQIINHFLIDHEWYLADLPGYGYARVSKTAREKWGPMMRQYLTMRPNLMLTFVLIDSRLEPQKADLEFINWLGEKGIPLALVFTKADKCTKNELQKNLAQFRRTLSESWEELPDTLVTSSETGAGIDELVTYIRAANDHWAALKAR